MTQIPILGINFKEFKAGFWDSYKHMMGTLLTLAKTEEKQVFYSQLDKLTMVYTNVEFTLTKKGILGHATSVKLKDSIPSKMGMKISIPCYRDSRKNGGAGCWGWECGIII